MGRTTPALAIANAAAWPLARSKRRPQAAWDRAVDKAAAAAGVEPDEADRQWIDDFGFLLGCVAEVPGLTPVGWVSSLSDARDRLAKRLHVRDLHRKHPEIGSEPIERPVFVVGLPRTATTLAHRVLAMSPAHRGPLRWEMYHPDLQRAPEIEERRINEVRKQGAVTRFAPDFEVIHPIEATKPEESILLLPHGLYHVLYHAPMPDYRAWLAERDTTVDYRYLKEVLQVLQHGRERRRWVLKNPLDLGQMSAIRKVFPDATFVWTHRDPATVMGSLCSLMDLSYALFLRRVDRAAVGSLALEVMAETVERGRNWRQKHPEAVVDVPYHRLASDPGRYVPELYKELGAKWSLSDGENLSQALARNIRDRKHEYSLGHYGLDEYRIQQTFGDYLNWVVALNS
ncbi:sulfotransferase family protein [Glycomyces tenuis]|uniref:sulfotransferase family protein n=1 Tax=Glycomyces tenuis TaxID=58116 RepID=UPI00041F65C5|nr:sulfotransferase [Glycomyces tenuis]